MIRLFFGLKATNAHSVYIVCGLVACSVAIRVLCVHIAYYLMALVAHSVYIVFGLVVTTSHSMMTQAKMMALAATTIPAGQQQHSVFEWFLSW